MKSKILIADDHDLVRETLAAYLASAAQVNVRQSRDLSDALDLIHLEGPFDLVLLDLAMPGMTMPEGLRKCLAANKPHPVALLTGATAEAMERRAIMDGAAGYLSKTLTPEELIARVREILAGRYARVEDLPERADATDPRPRGTPTLTPRELDVLAGLCEGKSNKEIARDLNVQEVTIKLHVKTLSRKIQARNRTHAAMLARDLHLL